MLAAFTARMGFWVYLVVQQYRGADFYGTPSSYIGVFGSLLLIVLSALVEGKLRIWMIVGAIGLLSFFGISTGEAAI